ncbi:MAG: hypothetical protein AAFU79_21645 [Myxococcota bacterium]
MNLEGPTRSFRLVSAFPTLALSLLAGAFLGCQDDGVGLRRVEREELPAPLPPAAMDVPPANQRQVDCSSDSITETIEVFFPARSGCSFSSDGNLPPQNESLQARAVDVASVDLPQIRVLCDLQLRSQRSPAIRFDDDVAILLEEVVLVAGGSGPALDEYPKVDGYPRFVWEEVRGQRFRPRSNPYACLGSPSLCQVPSTEQLGQLEVSFDANVLIALTQTLNLEAGFDLSFVTFGDNDPTDCAHGDLRMELEVSYLR